jgi:hypothetical protein
MARIVYLPQLNLCKNQSLSICAHDNNIRCAKEVLSNYLGLGFYCRAGLDVWPWQFESAFWHSHMPQTLIPDMPTTELSFDTATNVTANALRQTKFDRPWFVEWSGGIDSTAILVAIMKQFDRADYENVTVLLNATSVWENPDFFTQQIQPNFRYINSDQFDQDLCCRDHYRIHGDPGDMLWGATKGLQAKKDGVDLTGSWRRRDPRWTQFNDRLFGPEASEWIWQRMAQNIDSVPQYAIESVADWYWWLNFNFKWTQKMVYDLELGHKQIPTNFFASIVPWYAQPIYQQWSMSRGRFSLADGGIETYKAEAKDYIFDWDHNTYYHKFKTKFESGSRNLTSTRSSAVWALTDTLQILDHHDLCRDTALIDLHKNTYDHHQIQTLR